MERESTRTPRIRRASRRKDWLGDVRPPVALLWTVVRERVGEEIFPKRRSPPWKFQRVKAQSDVFEYLADDRRLGDESDDAHPLAATAEKRVDLVDAADKLLPLFPAGRKAGTVRSRKIGRFVLQRYREEDFASARDPALSVRVPRSISDLRNRAETLAPRTHPGAGRGRPQSPVPGVGEIPGEILTECGRHRRPNRQERGVGAFPGGAYTCRRPV